MTTHSGVEGTVKVGSNAVGEVTGFTITETAQTIDDSQLTDAWDTHLAGSKSWSAEVSAHWDEGDTNGQEALLVGASVTLNLYPEGSTSGDHYATGTATVTEVVHTVARNATIDVTFRCQGNGALTWGNA